MKYFENQEAEHDDDDLPFALSQDEGLLMKHSPHESTSSTLCSSSSDREVSFQESTSLAPPQLDSDGESQLSSSSAHMSELYTSESLSCADSHCMDAAASLLFPNSSLSMTISSLPIPSRNSFDSTSASSTANNDMGFSQLLKQAETATRSPRSVLRTLPVLPEDTSTSWPVTPPTSSPPARNSPRTHPTVSMLQSQATILEGMPSMHTDQRLASLAGATARRTCRNSFVVAIEVAGDESKVMDILGNPSALSMWCDAVPSLVVTECSESSSRGREYDAEFLQATTPYVIPPPNASCIYSLFRTIQSSLGFPTFGRVTMLVERQRGKVALTIGTFDGGIDVFHKIEIQPLAGGKVRVTDEVRLHCEDEGTWGSSLQSVFLPNVGDYMNQAISSMARLRFLVERGGNTCGYTPPVLASPDDDLTPLL